MPWASKYAASSITGFFFSERFVSRFVFRMTVITKCTQGSTNIKQNSHNLFDVNNDSCIKLFYLIGFNQGFNLCSFIILSDLKFAFKKDLDENILVFKQHVHKVHESTRLCTQRPGSESRSVA